MGNLSKVDWSLVSSAAEELSELPIFIDDSPDDSIRDYRIRCKLLRRDCPNFGLIFWDRILPPYEHGKPLEEILGTLQEPRKAGS